MTVLPRKVAGVYWTGWNQQIRITAIPTGYNLIYLFAARPSGTSGAVSWPHTALSAADIKTCRARGQLVLLSCGGAGHGINFASRAMSQAFVDSIVKLNADLGGTESSPVLDGVDFNTFEADATRNTAEYTWMGLELKRRFGSDFVISSPPAPWNKVDRDFCRALIAAGAMDYAAPQFYDSPNLVVPDRIVADIDIWVRDVAGGDASKICVGFGITQGSSIYSTPQQIVEAWNRVKQNHPTIRGAFVWQHKTDSDAGWPFSRQVIPLIGVAAAPAPPTGDTVTIDTSNYPLAGTDISRQADALVVYTSKNGTVTTTPTNQWGAEVPVLGGKVQSVVDRQTSGAAPVAIPKDGYVLSGHGKARDWLLAQAQVGDTVTGDVPQTPVAMNEFFAPVGCTLDQLRQKHNALVEHLGL